MNSRITARVNHFSRHHHATLRLLYGMVALALVGAALYLVLVYGILSSSSFAFGAKPRNSALSGGLSIASTTPVLSMINITAADNNTTRILKKGQDFRVTLGNNLRWNLTFTPASAVKRLPGIANEQSQGVYEAMTAGTITLKGTGAPICTPEEACPQLLADVTVNLVIQ